MLVNVRNATEFLRGNELANLPCLRKAYLVVEDGFIAEVRLMEKFRRPLNQTSFLEKGTMILPGWCDSHTHLVYAASREEEFVSRIQGKSHVEIAAAGGEILNSAKKIAAISEDQLFNKGWKRLGEVSSLGTGAIETKRGTPCGITPLHARHYINFVATDSKVAYLHICEGATRLDNGETDNKTGKLVSYLVSDFIKAHSAG